MNGSQLSISAFSKNDVLRVVLKGKLNNSTAKSFLEIVPHNKTDRAILINCMRLNEMDGTGFSAISQLISHCRSDGKEIRFSFLSGQPKTLMEHFNVSKMVRKNKQNILRSLMVFWR